MTTSRERAVKLDRRSLARLHAEIIDCADDPHKLSHHCMIADLREHGVEVSFKQIENALRALGYKWKEVFLPASNSDRGKKLNQPKADEWSVFSELDKTTDAHWSSADPDMQAVLDRIEQLEQTLTTNALAEHKRLREHVYSVSRDMLEKALERAVCIHTDVKRTVAESRQLHQQARGEAELAKERAVAIRTDMQTLLNRVDELAVQQQAVQRLVSSIRLHQDRHQIEQAQVSQEPQQ